MSHIPYASFTDIPGYPLSVGHCTATARICVVLRCEKCGTEATVVGRLLNELTANFSVFVKAHEDCAAGSTESQR